jgi:hypothetical protein
VQAQIHSVFARRDKKTVSPLKGTGRPSVGKTDDTAAFGNYGNHRPFWYFGFKFGRIFLRFAQKNRAIRSNLAAGRPNSASIGPVAKLITVSQLARVLSA